MCGPATAGRGPSSSSAVPGLPGTPLFQYPIDASICDATVDRLEERLARLPDQGADGATGGDMPMPMRAPVRIPGGHGRRAALVAAAALSALVLAGLTFALPPSPRSLTPPGAHAA